MSLKPAEIKVKFPHDASTGPIDVYDHNEKTRYDMFFVCGPQPPVAPVPCYFSQVDEHDWGKYVSMALDGIGSVYLSFYDDKEDKLMFAHYNTFPCSKSPEDCKKEWAFMHFDTSYDFGRFTSIAVDKGSGSIAISAVDENGNLRVARYTQTWTGEWKWFIDLVDSSGKVGGMNTSITTNSDGCPLVTYYKGGDYQDLMFAESYLVGTYPPSCHWKSPIRVDGGGGRDVGLYNSIAMNNNDEPIICYYDKTQGDLMYATRSGGSWVTTDVDIAGDVGRHCDITVGTDGRPMISYSDTTNDALKYADFDPRIGDWQRVTVANFTEEYCEVIDTNITVGENGMPYISFTTFSKIPETTPSMVGYATIKIADKNLDLEDIDISDPKWWFIKTIGFGEDNDITYYNHSPRIVYYDPNDKNLNYWYDQRFDMEIYSKPCPENPETISVEITNDDLKKLSAIASIIGGLISVEIPPVPLDKKEGKCECPWWWPKCPWEGKYEFALIGKVEFSGSLRMDDVNLFWSRSGDKDSINTRFDFKTIEAKGYADFQLECVEWGQIEGTCKLKDLKLEIGFVPVITCGSMQLELGDVFFHELTKHNVDIDFDYIGSDIESDVIDPILADWLNDNVFNDQAENDIKNTLIGSQMDKLLEDAFLNLLVLADQSGFLRSLQQTYGLKLSQIEFLSANYANDKGTFLIDKNKTLENVR